MASELALSLADRGHDVHVFSHATPPRLASATAQRTVRVHLSAAPPYPLFEAPPHDLAMVSRILEVVRNSGLDLLHAHYALPHAVSAVLASEAAADMGSPLDVVTTLHGTDITAVGSDPAFAPLVRFALLRSSAVSCVSDSLATDTRATFFAESTPPAIEVIPNFVDTEEFHPDRPRQPGPPRVVHASNLRPVKRVPWLIETFAQATKRGSGAESTELWVVGEGPDLTASTLCARDLGIAGRVRFLGVSDEVAPLFVGARAFALASETESFGLSALEAMAAGVPTVTPAVGGLPEVVQHGETGFLCPPNDQVAFASRLRSLCVDHELASSMGKMARARAVHGFAREALVDRYEALYAHAQDRGRPDTRAVRRASEASSIGGEPWKPSGSI
jgi:N-acetyl-alpha-D-glucosaminyl L-malate synthase BshA